MTSSRKHLADGLDRLPELSYEATMRMVLSEDEAKRPDVEREILLEWVKIGDYFRIDDPRMVPLCDDEGKPLRGPGGVPQMTVETVRCGDCRKPYANGITTVVYLHPEQSKREFHVFPYRVFHVLASDKRHPDDISAYVKTAQKILSGKPLE